jgi:putative endonuclease
MSEHEFGWQAPPRRICQAVLAPAAQFLARRTPREWFSWGFELFPSGRRIASRCDMPLSQAIVYVLKSKADPTRYYTGLTSSLAQRLDSHNAGRVPHTARYKPWMIDVVVQFSDQSRAMAFEKYLKSGSGCAFAQRHFR